MTTDFQGKGVIKTFFDRKGLFLRGFILSWSSIGWEMRFQPALQLPPGEKNFMPAGQTNQANIRPQPDNLPLKAAAGVGFAQSDFISNLDLCKHGWIITSA